jgi:hypothetical protein
MKIAILSGTIIYVSFKMNVMHREGMKSLLTATIVGNK